MKQAFALFSFLLFSTYSFAQETEFGSSQNGLIYSDTTIHQLKYIVDSLHLKFKVCDLNRIYHSKLQAKAHFIHLKKGAVKEAKKDMEAGISFNDFVKKYNHATIDENLVVVKFEYTDYNEDKVIEFSNTSLNHDEHELTFKKSKFNYNIKALKGKWLYKDYPKDEYTPESISAFYVLEEFSQRPIPIEYSHMIQYSDCMVDTSTQIFYDDAKESGVRYDNQISSKVTEFMDYMNEATGKPHYNYEAEKGKTEAVRDSLYAQYRKNYRQWYSLKAQKADSLKLADKKFTTLFREAEAEALSKGGTYDEFEEYVAIYSSKKNALEMKRHRIVYGGCSQDRSPRVHALNIALLSAETVNWEIFLRAHLDIMNDRFERASDGSYAWKERKTYIKELEVLDINVIDLLLGISLRIEDPSNNHYYGDIGRLGRALSETKQPMEVEEKMLQMISNDQLDDYNRIIIYYLFLNYNYNLENTERKEANKIKIKAVEKTLPNYIYTKLLAGKKKK